MKNGDRCDLLGRRRLARRQLVVVMGAAASCLLSAGSFVNAASTLTWNVGSGTWNPTNTNWSGVTWANGSDGTFTSTGGTVTTNAADWGGTGPSADALYFGGAYTLSGDALITLTGKGITSTATTGLVINNNLDFTNNGSISSTANVTTATLAINGNITLATGTTVEMYDGKGTINQTGTITGNGSVIFGGSGESSNIVPSATNNFTGNVTLGNETVNVSLMAVGGTPSSFGAGTGTISLSIGGGPGTVVFNSPSAQTTDRQIVFLGSANATITNNGAGAVTFTSTAVATSGGGPKTVTFNGTSTAANSFAEPIVDDSTSGGSITLLTKTGAGNWTLSGTETYTGATTISGGRLILTGGAGNTAISVNTSGATLAVNPSNGGSVNIGTTSTASAGASLSLVSGAICDMSGDGAAGTAYLLQGSGVSAAALTAASATFKFDLLNATADKLAVGGVASVSGTNLIGINTSAATSLTPGAYPLITATSGLSGTFSLLDGNSVDVVTVGSNSYDLSLTDSSTAVTLNVTNATPEPSSVTLIGMMTAFPLMRRRRRSV